MLAGYWLMEPEYHYDLIAKNYSAWLTNNISSMINLRMLGLNHDGHFSNDYLEFLRFKPDSLKELHFSQYIDSEILTELEVLVFNQRNFPGYWLSELTKLPKTVKKVIITNFTGVVDTNFDFELIV